MQLSEAVIGRMMRAEALACGHKPKLPKRVNRNGLEDGEEFRSERLLKALKGKSLTRYEIAAALDVTYATALNYLRPLLKSGQVVRFGEGLRVEEFRLPDYRAEDDQGAE